MIDLKRPPAFSIGDLFEDTSTPKKLAPLNGCNLEIETKLTFTTSPEIVPNAPVPSRATDDH